MGAVTDAARGLTGLEGLGGMKRRSLLLGASGLVLGAALAGCRRVPKGSTLQVDLLEGSVPPVLLDELQRQFKPDARYQIRQADSLAGLYARLQTYRPSPAATAADGEAIAPTSRFRANIVGLGDAWLASAIREGLIQPLAVETLPGWAQVPAPWQQLVRRNAEGFPDAAGQVWAAPYRWGTLAIAYRKDHFDDQPPTDWDDLWQPKLTRRISLPDQARVMLGLTLKSLGESANSDDLGSISALPAALAQLHQQVRFYSSTAYLEPLILDDTWLAVGWSTDILPLLKKNPRIGAVVPQSGTLLFADTWVRPVAPKSASATTDAVSDSATLEALIQRWLAFYWEAEVATRMSLLGTAASPLVAVGDRSTLPESLQANTPLLPSAEILERSEFLTPLSEATAQTYRRLWLEVRQG